MPKPKKDYVVKAGDNLSKIAKEIYGDARMFAEIQRNNPWYNGVLRPGQVLKLPGKRSNPFVSNTEAAAAGMQGGTYETGYGFTGERAGELNALSAGVRDTGRQINPNTPWGFNQATQVAQQYYGGAGSQVGAPPAPAPTASQMAATPAPSTTTQQQGQGMQQQYFNQAQQASRPKPQAPVAPAQNSQYPGAAATGISAPTPSTASGAFQNPLSNPLNPRIQTPQSPQGPTPSGAAQGQPAQITPATASQSGVRGLGSGWGSPVQGSHFDYQTAGVVITSIVAGNGPSVVSAKDLYGISNGAGLDPTLVAQDMMSKGYKFDPATRSMYKPDSALSSLGIPSLTLGPSVPSEFVGLPPVTPPSGYGPPRPVYTDSGRQESGLSLPPMAEVGNANASWNIGP